MLGFRAEPLSTKSASPTRDFSATDLKTGTAARLVSPLDWLCNRNRLSGLFHWQRVVNLLVDRE